MSVLGNVCCHWLPGQHAPEICPFPTTELAQLYCCVPFVQNQDISTKDGDRLYSLCKTVMDEGPLVFVPLAEESRNRKYQEEVAVYVPKWMPFQELLLLLRAGLREIGDRWVWGWRLGSAAGGWEWGLPDDCVVANSSCFMA